MKRARRDRARGFTLLEGVLALAMLTAVVAACLQLRARVGEVGRRVQRDAASHNAEEALFQSLINGLLGEPTTDGKTGLLVWEGEQNGTSYRVTRAPARGANPLAGRVPFDAAAEVAVFRYEVRLGREVPARVREFIWHR